MGGFRLMKVFGITVFVHWSWLLAAAFLIRNDGRYNTIAWNIAEYLTLFAIVLMHEFGHLLACRSVGGKGDFIMLWPLGGVAFGKPPDRPWPTLWTVVGGPLVNVVLIPVTWVLYRWSGSESGPGSANIHTFLHRIMEINVVLLVFNMLPIFPLDGGQTLRALLWFVIGRGRSLQVATVIGLIALVPGALWALSRQEWFLVVIVVFAAIQAIQGFKIAQRMLQEDRDRANGIYPTPPQ